MDVGGVRIREEAEVEVTGARRRDVVWEAAKFKKKKSKQLSIEEMKHCCIRCRRRNVSG